jgi:integrase
MKPGQKPKEKPKDSSLIGMRRYAWTWIEQYPSVAKVNEAIAGARRMGSSGTVENYVKAIRRFVAFLKLEDPETALQKLLNGEVNAQVKADAFIDYLLDKEKGLGYAHGTARNYVFGIRKWFDLNGVRVDWNKIELPTSTEISEDDRVPTKEELKLLLNHAASARDRFVIYGGTSSGLRIGTLLSLNVGDVDFNYPDVARITVERKRGRKFSSKRSGTAGRLFCTFITPEAKTALQQYLEERKAAGEKLGPESLLIGDAYHKGRRETVEGYEKVWARLLRRAGLAEKCKRWFFLHIHTLRKYFRSNCVGIDASYRERWMGHKGGYLDISYFKAEEPLHLAEYRKAIPHLTIYATSTDEKNLRKKMLIDFARMQGTPEDELRKLDEIFARAKDVDEGIKEFRRFKDELSSSKEQGSIGKTQTMHNGNSKYLVAKGEDKMIQKLHEGYQFVQPLNGDKYLLQLS